MGLFDKAKELSNSALEKGKNLAQITKLNVEISTLEAKINDSKKNIGNIIFSKSIIVDNPDIQNEIEKINNYNKEIQDKRNQIGLLETK